MKKQGLMIVLLMGLAAAAHAAEKRPALSPSMAMGSYKPLSLPKDQGDPRSILRQAVVRKSEGASVIDLDNGHTLPLVEKNGVFVFSESFGDGDCDDPGCGNLTRIFGVVYNKRINDKWVPTVKASVEIDFPYPESDDDYDGPVTFVAHFGKK